MLISAFYSIENYFTVDAINKVFGKKIKMLDYNISLDKQLGFIENGKRKKTIKSKNHDIIKNMKLWSKGTVEGTRNDIIAKLLNNQNDKTQNN